uniref:Uncharacterized protein n=1 Tax=Cacopsylla melanoneura TaxID=428564 RepID=A0A8D9EZH5_9HEMI
MSRDSTESITPKSSLDKSAPITHNGHQFILKYAVKDGNLLYKCTERSCLARVMVAKGDLSVMKVLSQHSGHKSSPLVVTIDKEKGTTPLSATKNTKASKSTVQRTLSTPTKTNQSVQLGKQTSQQSKSCESLNHSKLGLDKTGLLPPKSLARQTQDAFAPAATYSPSIETVTTVELGDQSSESTSLPLQSSNYYQIKYEEAHSLNSALIDRLMEKERKLCEQESTISDLRKMLSDLEVSRASVNPPSNVSPEISGSEQIPLPLPGPSATSFAGPSETSPTRTKTQLAETRGNTQTWQTRVTLVGDSHVRRLQSEIKFQIPSWDVKCLYKGGSKLGQVLDLLEGGRIPADNNILIVFSGTNDVSQTTWKIMKKSYEEIITKYNSCKIGIFLIPLRREPNKINNHIKLINNKIVSFLSTKDVVILDPQILDKEDYSPDGLHLNRLGNEKLCEVVKTKFEAEIISAAARGKGVGKTWGPKRSKSEKTKSTKSTKTREVFNKKSNSNVPTTKIKKSVPNKRSRGNTRTQNRTYYNSDYGFDPHQYDGFSSHRPNNYNNCFPYTQYFNEYHCEPYFSGYSRYGDIGDYQDQMGRPVGQRFFR